MKKNFNYLALIVCTIGFSSLAHAQSMYKISSSKDNGMKMSGTSTLHKWNMTAQTFTGDAQFDLMQGSNSKLTALKSLSFSLPVQNLKSGEKALDKNAYKALKTSQYKDIFYKLTSATIMPEKDNKYQVKTNGNLTVAGVTKEVSMDVWCNVNSDASITCTGSDKLKMTDYSVKPPTFMLGAMKTGDAITLDFTLVYKK